MTSPDSADGSTISQLVALTQIVQRQAEILETLKGLPEAVQSLQQHEIQQNTNLFENDTAGVEDVGIVNSLPTDDLFVGLLDSQAEETNTGQCEGEALISLLLEQEDAVDYGPAVNKIVGDGMLKAVTKPISKETIEAFKNKIKVPENCKLLGVPRVNPEIWNSLPNKARISDLRLQQLQLNTSQGLVVLSRIADVIARSPPTPNAFAEIMQHVKDGVTLLGTGHQHLTSRRRIDIKYHIQPEYAGICSGPIEPSEFLFGDNLEDLLKKSKATSELMKKVTPIKRPHYTKPYTRAGASGSTNLNFSRPSPENYRRGGQYRGQFRGQWRNQRRGQH